MALTTFVAGDVLEAQQLNDSFAFVQTTYTTYTPTVSGWTAGNGTFADTYYGTQGKMVNYQGVWTFGSTSAVTATALEMTLPVNAFNSLNAYVYGVCTFFDASTGVQVSGYVRLQNDTDMFFYWHDPEAAPIAVRLESWITGVTLPFTFATGDKIAWNITYRTA
jgi:hypothetical protein